MQTCFVIQPFDVENNKRYDEVYMPALEEAGVRPYRVDRDPTVTIPIESIEKQIRESDICLADITTNNPNVWYELGFASALGRPVVLICDQARVENLPFDVRHRAVLKYETESPSDFERFRAALVERVVARLNDTDRALTNSGEDAAVGDNCQSFGVPTQVCSAAENGLDVTDDCGWLQSVTIEESPVFARGSTLDLARITLVLGANASGKTALCEWLAGGGDISLLKRWSALSKPRGRTQVRFDAVTPVPLTWTIQVFAESNIKFELDGQAVPQLNLAYGFVYASARPRWIPEETTSSYLARWLHIDPAHLHNVVRSLNMSGGSCVHNPRFVTLEDHEALLLDLDGTAPGLDFRSLSSSEQIEVVIEFAVELARFEAERRPTILLIDCMAGFERAMVQEYLEFLAPQSKRFQIIVTACPPSGNEERFDGDLEGLRIATLRGTTPKVEIS